ncbi:MAG: PEP-CTERM sorting domain-containing protein [Gammaproteobacteria bacterium]|nr:PEP-CTERM sorting domain-containing protein [Gammaproteobacteria bacterium]
MRRTQLSCFYKYIFHSVVTLGLVAACCQLASATSSVFNDGSWTQIANDDGVESGGYVNPGWGGQDFDAEYLAYKLIGNTLSIGIQAGFDLVDGKVTYDGHDYYAGDLALSFDNTPSTYEYAFDFGLFTKNYAGTLVDADVPSPDGIDNAGLYKDVIWNTGVYSAFTASNPFAMDGGSLVSGANGITTADYDSTRDSYWRIVSFDITSILAAGDIANLSAHWTMSCGNDVINGTDRFPVPEPGAMLLFGTGLAGLAGIQRRRLSKK